MDQIDKRSKTAGFSLMYDVTGAGLSNVEMVSMELLIGGLVFDMTPILTFKVALSIQILEIKTSNLNT